jgi:hypothetical protein
MAYENSAYDGATSTMMVSPVIDQFGGLQKYLVELSSEVERLESKLSDVLGPHRPTAEAADKNPESDMSPLANQLRGERKTVQMLVYRVRAIIDRLEV